MPTQPDDQRMTQKMISIKDEPFYANCSMVETTPFDISILFGKLRPRADEKGETRVVEVYEKQIYLSHLQARALYDAIGRSLGSLTKQQRPTESQKQ